MEEKGVFSLDHPCYVLCFAYDMSEDSSKGLSVTTHLSPGIFSLTLDMPGQAVAFCRALNYI